MWHLSSQWSVSHQPHDAKARRHAIPNRPPDETPPRPPDETPPRPPDETPPRQSSVARATYGSTHKHCEEELDFLAAAPSTDPTRGRFGGASRVPTAVWWPWQLPLVATGA